MDRLKALKDLLIGFFTGSSNFQTPDVPKVPMIALGQAVVAAFVAFGFDLSNDDRELLLGLAAALGAILPISDAAVRRERARSSEKIAAARGEASEEPPVSDAQRSHLLDLLMLIEPDQAPDPGRRG